MPSKLTFNTGAAEIMDVVAGSCWVKLAGSTEAKQYVAGESFHIPENSSFEIDVQNEPFHYVCHYA